MMTNQFFKNLRWASEMQAMTARSRSTFTMLDIAVFLFGGDDTGRKNPVVCDGDGRYELL